MRVVVKGDFSPYVMFHSCGNSRIHEISFLREGEGASELGAERERETETETETESQAGPRLLAQSLMQGSIP